MFKPLKKNAFTILELLVVIVLLGLLAAVLVIGIKSSIDQGKLANIASYGSTLYRSLSDSAIALWDMDEGSGNDIYDKSNNGYNIIDSAGIDSGFITWSDESAYRESGGGTSRKSLSFINSGSNNLVSNKSLPGCDRFTIIAWVKWNKNYIGSAGTIFSRSSSNAMADPGDILFSKRSTDVIRIDIRGPVTTYLLQGTTNINDGKWHLIAAVYDGSSFKLYVDAKLDPNSTYVPPIAGILKPATPNNNLPRIGNYGASINDRWKGWIDEMHLYSDSFSQAEIQKLYAKGLNYHLFVNK